jgi:diaminopimelate decarboxylase
VNHFQRRDGELFAEGVPLSQIAREVGTPAYVYSAATLRRHFRVFDGAFSDIDHLTCFAVKALSNIAVLHLLAQEGAGFDIVSGGELARVMAAGGDPKKIVFSGVGKTRTEMQQALEAGILCFNVESRAELFQLDEVARKLCTRAPVSLRINPDVDPQTHPYIATGLRSNKFGIQWDQAEEVYQEAGGLEGIEVKGLDCHIGSQISSLEPMVEAMEKMVSLVDRLESMGLNIEHLDVGGGLGITYDDETPPSPSAYASELIRVLGTRKKKIITEPGRVIAGNAGILLTQVLLRKQSQEKTFLIVDAGMNDSIRPALYNAWHGIEAVADKDSSTEIVDVVGPVCESGDFLARERELPVMGEGDLVAMRSAGAYGFVMASNYNSRPRIPEVLVQGDAFQVIRKRETIADLFASESLPDL